MLSRWIKRLAIPVAIIGIVCLLAYLRDRSKPVIPDSKDHLIPENIYRPPVVKLPFIKDKQPIPDKELPILKEEVSKTIAITVQPSDKTTEIELVVDREGKIHRTIGSDKDIPITVTEWREKTISFPMDTGYSIVYSGEWYHCLSLDYFRVGRLFFGSELGVSQKELFNKLLAGLSLKYKIGTLDFRGGNEFDFLGVVGYNFIGQKAYIGINIQW